MEITSKPDSVETLKQNERFTHSVAAKNKAKPVSNNEILITSKTVQVEILHSSDKQLPVNMIPTFRTNHVKAYFNYLASVNYFLTLKFANYTSSLSNKHFHSKGVQICKSLIKFHKRFGSKEKDIQKVQDSDKPVTNKSTLPNEAQNPSVDNNQTNETATTTNAPQTPQDGQMVKFAGTKHADNTESLDSNKRSRERRRVNNPNVVAPEQIGERQLRRFKGILRNGIYCVCLFHTMLMLATFMMCISVYCSNLKERPKNVLLICMGAGIIMKSFFVISVFCTATKEYPDALCHCACFGCLVCFMQILLGLMGFFLFLRLAYLTVNFFILIYFCGHTIIEIFTFCRASMIIAVYRDLLLSNPIDKNSLYLAACCSDCNLVRYIHRIEEEQRNST